MESLLGSCVHKKDSGEHEEYRTRFIGPLSGSACPPKLLTQCERQEAG